MPLATIPRTSTDAAPVTAEPAAQRRRTRATAATGDEVDGESGSATAGENIGGGEERCDSLSDRLCRVWNPEVSRHTSRLERQALVREPFRSRPLPKIPEPTPWSSGVVGETTNTAQARGMRHTAMNAHNLVTTKNGCDVSHGCDSFDVLSDDGILTKAKL